MENKTFTTLRLNSFEKGKKAQIGEVHNWKGKMFRKTTDGWKELPKSKKSVDMDAETERYSNYSPKSIISSKKALEEMVDRRKRDVVWYEEKMSESSHITKEYKEYYDERISALNGEIKDLEDKLKAIEPFYQRAISFDRDKMFYPVKEWDKLSVDKVKEIFDKYNDDEDIKDFSEKVFAVAKRLEIPVGVGKLKKASGLYKFSGIILYDEKIFNEYETSPHRFTSTLLHEMIHACTSTYLHKVESGNGHMLPSNIREACEELIAIHSAAKKQLKGAYGATDVHEMVAEISNRKFRGLLKAVGLWKRVVASLAKLFYGKETKGTEKVDGLERVKRAINVIVENADAEWINKEMQRFYDMEESRGVRHTFPRPKFDVENYNKTHNMQHFQFLSKSEILNNMQSAFNESWDDFLEKGKRAEIGEIREWRNGKKYQKTAQGWIPYLSHSENKAQETPEKSQKKAVAQNEHPGWPKFEGLTGPQEFGSPQFEENLNVLGYNDKVYATKDEKGNLVWSQDRIQKVHKPIVDSYVKRGKKNQQGVKTVTLMMGAPASGKGSIQKYLAKAGEMDPNVVAVDPDEIKTKALQPDYARYFERNPKRAASHVHEEGSDIAKEVFKEMEKNGFDYLQDKVFADYGKLIKEIKRLDSLGYKVKIIKTKLPFEEGIKRMKARGEHTGRFVPEDYMKEQYAQVDATWAKLKETMPGNVLSAVEYDTMEQGNPKKSDEWLPENQNNSQE